MKHSLSCLAVLAVVAALGLDAAETPSTQLIKLQGEGEGRTSGDFISATDSLNTFYRFMIEVTPDVTTLDVDLFDADVGGGGTGGGNNEEAGTSGRDRDRANGYASTAIYTLRRPNGTAFTTLTCTTTCGGAAADAIWTDFAAFSGDFVLDQFAVAAYNNNNGTVNWAGNWAEVNDDGAAGSGQVQIIGGELRVTPANALRGAERTVNTSAFGSATLTFTNRAIFAETADQWVVQVSSTGAAPFTTLETFSGTFAATARSYDISGFLSTTTIVRFARSAAYDDSSGPDTERFFVNDVRIQGSDVTNGHWMLDVDMTSSGGDDINGFGIRTTGSLPGSTDLNVYAANMVHYGTNDGTNNAIAIYPWVTSGCKCKFNDFDFDSVGTAAMVAADGTAFGPYVGVSANNTWATVQPGYTSGTAPAAGWTTASDADGYGIFALAATSPSYGGSVANYGLFYLANETSVSANTTEPASRAPAGAFRLYMPADGAASGPVKPYLEQFLRYTTALPGANPPTAGQTSRYAVTVRFTNPTAYQVTSATSTSTVPASATFVTGSILASAGTSASYSAGTVTWTIGTVAPGASVLMSYRVDISGTGLPRNATGTVTTGGTSISYTDETGTVIDTLGPLCELSVRTALATDAVIGSFEAVRDRGGVTLLWTTSSEAGARGFNLLRQSGASWKRVNSDLIACVSASGAPGSYAVSDSGATGPATYRIEEMTSDGRTLSHGPYSVVPRPWKAGDPSPDGVSATALPPAPPIPKPGSINKKSKADALFASVVERGIHSISATDIAATLGMDYAAAVALIGNGGFSLTNRGVPVLWTRSATGDAILFYGEASGNIYSVDNEYKLEKRVSRTMRVTQVSPSASGPANSFVETQHVERDVFAATVLPLDPEGDFWFSDAIPAGTTSASARTIQFDLTDVAPGAGEVRVNVQSFAATDNEARVTVNGAPLGSLQWSGIAAATATVAVPAGTLREGSNSVVIEAVRLPGSLSGGFYLDSIDVAYERWLNLSAGTLVFSGRGATTIDGVDGADSVLLDVTNAKSPSLVVGGALNPAASGYKLSFNATEGHRYAIADVSGIRRASTRVDRTSGLASSKNAANFVLVTHSSMRGAAEEYARYRSTKGLLTLVVDAEELYDEFDGGVESPHAVRSFIAATRSWRTRPSTILLAGSGTYDYRGMTGDPSLIPPMLRSTPRGIFASDIALADVNGDSKPDVWLGRIPASTSDELLGYLDKVRRYEQSATARLLFAADDPDNGTSFAQTSQSLGDLTGAITSVDLTVTPVAIARLNLFNQWHQGLGLVNWVGHGGLDRFASEGLLMSADVGSLSSVESLPVVVALTCIVNRFEIAGFQTLGEDLVRRRDAGAVAVWAPSALLENDASSQLGAAFYRQATKGDAPLGALIDYALRSVSSTDAAFYLLLGDPELRLRKMLASTTSSPAE